MILPTKRDEMTVRCLKSGPSEKTPIHTVGHQDRVVNQPHIQIANDILKNILQRGESLGGVSYKRNRENLIM